MFSAFFLCAGSGGVWPSSPGNVPVEPASGACTFHGLLARLVRSPDLLLFQHSGSACITGEASFPFPDKVIDEILWSYTQP